MCCTEELAAQLDAYGANVVLYWPSRVPDAVAIDFGVEMIAQLPRHSIGSSFRRADATLSTSEWKPKLLSRTNCADSEDPSRSALTKTASGGTASIHLQNSNGSIRLVCQDHLRSWSCHLCNRVFDT